MVYWLKRTHHKLYKQRKEVFNHRRRQEVQSCRLLGGSMSTTRCLKPNASFRVACLSAALLQAVTSGLQVGSHVSPWSLHSYWKRTPLERLTLRSRWQFRGAVSRLLDTRSEAMTASQPKNKTDCQARSPWGKKETAATFGRVMSSVARQPGENIEGIACFYSIFLSLSLSGGKVCSPTEPLLPPSIMLVLTAPSLPTEMCYTGWKANFHHSAHEYWMAPSSFD